MAIQYDIHRSTTNGFTPSTTNKIATDDASPYVDSNVPDGTYYYRIIARDTVSNTTSQPSAQFSVTVGTPPPPPEPGGSGSFPGPKSGLRWSSGAFNNHNNGNERLGWESWRGKQNDVSIVFANFNNTTEGVKTWWKGLDPTFTGKWWVAMPLCPTTHTISSSANGSLDSFWHAVGTANSGSVVRLAWEMNLLHDPRKNMTTGNVTEFIAAWRRVATILRGHNCQISWNPNVGRGQTGNADPTVYVEQVKDLVDFAGPDSYDWYNGSLTEAAFRTKEAQTGYVIWWANWCRTNNKRLCIPEWGLVGSGVANTTNKGGGDNAVFINTMLEICNENADLGVVEAYFNDYADTDAEIYPSTRNPNAAAAYKAALPLYVA